MKHKKIVLALMMVLLALFMTACKNDMQKYDGNISEKRINIFKGESVVYSVTAITGRRENPYKMDGVSGEKKDFTVVTVVPTAILPGKTYSYEIDAAEGQFKGDFLPHPFAESLSCEIDRQLLSNEFNIIIKVEEKSESLTMTGIVPTNIISVDKALSIALTKLKPQIKELTTGGKLNAEIYVTLTENPIDNSGGLFWYVAFVSEEDITCAVLLKGETGDVGAIRT